MPRTIILTHHYPASADDVWALATDLDSFPEVMKGVATFTGLPGGQIAQGQKISVQVSILGILPAQPYHMDVVECDPAARMFRSLEHGAGVKSWQHELTVTPTETGATLTDHVIINAGLLTPLFVLWARYVYGARHKPRLRLLQHPPNGPYV
ncbi:SRPBCC family protein [Actibacterium sp. 188UL27-1]|uniref:SRPBCC family protein n=1 Tax=Actibacterium sp. 188UL27-1 TaxID=2786961 RepID=UPI001956E86F|nr:SRPBCC family protein [Actibacterium sp. 188UL27-1]MBM7068261.1 SRPBCC family protein [Actibacterium sp. 188UL27-1]